MLPIIVKIGPVTIRTYGLMYATGVLLGVLASLQLAKRENLNPSQFLDFIFYTLLVSILGAKAFLILTNIGFYLRYPAELKYVILSGGSFFGGLLSGLIFGTWWVKKKKLPLRSMGDVSLPGLALGHFLGRLGCLGAGCCFGREAAGFPLAMTFSNEKAHSISGVPLHTPLYPTQLAEAALNLLNFLFLIWLFPRRRFKGQVMVLYLFNYSLIRFVIEYFRGDPERGFIFGGSDHPFTSLSLPQLISIGGFILAVLLYRAFRKKGEQENLS